MDRPYAVAILALSSEIHKAVASTRMIAHLHHIRLITDASSFSVSVNGRVMSQITGPNGVSQMGYRNDLKRYQVTDV